MLRRRGAGRVSLLDADAPTSAEVAYAQKVIDHQEVIHGSKHAGKGRLQQAYQIPHSKIEAANTKLQKRVRSRRLLHSSSSRP